MTFQKVFNNPKSYSVGRSVGLSVGLGRSVGESTPQCASNSIRLCAREVITMENNIHAAKFASISRRYLILFLHGCGPPNTACCWRMLLGGLHRPPTCYGPIRSRLVSQVPKQAVDPHLTNPTRAYLTRASAASSFSLFLYINLSNSSA